jgi:hypothetical protein
MFKPNETGLVLDKKYLHNHGKVVAQVYIR